MANKPKDFPVFTHVDKYTIDRMAAKIIKLLGAKIAICLFTNAIYYNSEKTKKDRRISEHFINNLYYSLLYRDISKESLMILAECFVEEK